MPHAAFSAAAEALGIPQRTVTKTLARLEPRLPLRAMTLCAPLQSAAPLSCDPGAESDGGATRHRTTSWWPRLRSHRPAPVACRAPPRKMFP